ncbi:type III-B CRISPR module-associated protein Cmr5 [Wukongibacter sp. M2B1]|uniref:type III-B CRISPR module-associated protein Cmr5 n=1 Tax=Wukongibacter sp. M2B1 TaxID=3088895 RepID=UPI003D7A0306
MNHLKNIRREKSRMAYKEIEVMLKEEVASDPKEHYSQDFKGHIKNIPMYIFNNGLIATYAFIIKKSTGSEGKSYKKIQDIIYNYLKSKDKLYEQGQPEKLVDIFINLDNKQYRKTTLDLLLYLEALVQFSDAMIEKNNKAVGGGE